MEFILIGRRNDFKEFNRILKLRSDRPMFNATLSGASRGGHLDFVKYLINDTLYVLSYRRIIGNIIASMDCEMNWGFSYWINGVKIRNKHENKCNIYKEMIQLALDRGAKIKKNQQNVIYKYYGKSHFFY